MTKKEIGDLAGVGQLIDSEIAQQTYKDGLSPAMKEVGSLAADTMKTVRLLSAPVQLLAAYQDRFSSFCDRVGAKVPDEFQQPAPANIAKPVLEAFAFTEDDSSLMDLFEELMSKAIDTREAPKLNPIFPDIIKNLSPIQAKLIKALKVEEQITDDLMHIENNMIMERLYSNFSFDDFGGDSHHLTLIQDLKNKNIVTMNSNSRIEPPERYSSFEIQDGHNIKRTKIYLSMFGKWFADSCIREE